MRLTSARITNFKCIDDSGTFTIGDLTCLVGKNESGKTAILQALEKLNPVNSRRRRFDPVDFPRQRATDLTNSSNGSDQQVLETFWELEPEDRASIEAYFGVDFVDDEPIRITRGFDNLNRWTIHFDESRIVDHVISSAYLEDWEREGYADAGSVGNLIKRLRSADLRTSSQQALLDDLERLFPTSRVINSLVAFLQKRLPRLLYFADYYNLPGRVSLDDFARRQEQKALRPQDRMFQALLGLAGTRPDDIERIGRLEEVYSELEAVSTRLSSEIFRYWSQNSHLRVDFRYDASRTDDDPPFNTGHVFSTRVIDTRHGVSLSFDERSSGFVWFFSFLVWLTYLRERSRTRLIILLDEPARSLHGRAQADLLRYFREQLVPESQVIYTTHSPFMIDASDLSSVRVVEDGHRVTADAGERGTGTTVRDGAIGDDPDALFPVQTALVTEAARSFQIGGNVVLAETPAQMLYVNWISEELRRRGREALDARWTVVPSGDLHHLADLLALAGSNGSNLIRLSSGGSRQSQPAAANGRFSSAATHLVQPAKYVGRKGADFEDMLGRPLFAELVNRAYGLKGNRRMPKDRRRRKSRPVIEEAKLHFERRFGRQLEFDRITPAKYLARVDTASENGLPGLDLALDRFERMFSDLNQRLEARSGE